MKFFEPSNEFIKWLTNYSKGRLTFDIGSGDGQVLLALQQEGCKAIGIDPHWDIHRENYMKLFNSVLPMYAQECSMIRRENLLILFCRPCHNGFVSETLDHLHPSSEALYISKPSNVMVDLDDFEYEEVESPACEVEKVYRVGKRIRESEISRINHDFDGARDALRNLRRLVGSI